MITERERALWLTIDRPAALNAVDESVLAELEAACSRVEDDESLRALAITGTGDAFSVGMDLGCLERGFADHAWFRSFLERFHAVLLRLERLPVPTLAVVNGLARAGGFEIILACDVAIAADGARIADNHLPFGVIPGAGATQRAPRRLGAMRATELILGGRWMGAGEAERAGLVLEVVPRAGLDAAAETILDRFRARSRDALAAAKAAIVGGAGLPIEEGVKVELDHFFGYLETSPDATEGFRAYREGRPPRWRT